jgi:hypothetical protein
MLNDPRFDDDEMVPVSLLHVSSVLDVVRTIISHCAGHLSTAHFRHERRRWRGPGPGRSGELVTSGPNADVRLDRPSQLPRFRSRRAPGPEIAVERGLYG